MRADNCKLRRAEMRDSSLIRGGEERMTAMWLEKNADFSRIDFSA